jgi:hypothetical protein
VADGAHVLVVVEAPAVGRHANDLWVIDVSTHELRRIPTPTPRPDPYGLDEELFNERYMGATFSPDGRSIAVVSDVEGRCGRPRTWNGCECDNSLYSVGVDGTGWRRMSEVPQTCGAIFWVR